ALFRAAARVGPAPPLPFRRTPLTPTRVMDQRAAFARARSFLNYHPTAKWSALAADIGAGILYVALLLLLGLFLPLVLTPAEPSPRAGRLDGPLVALLHDWNAELRA